MDPRLLSKAKIEARGWVEFTLPELTLFDSSDAKSLRSARTDVAAFLAPYVITQAWAHFLMGVPGIDGMLYRSRHDANQLCLALFGTPRLMARGFFAAKKVGEPVADIPFLRWLASQNIGVL